MMYGLVLLLILVIGFGLILYYCYHVVFERAKKQTEAYDLPPGEQYETRRDQSFALIDGAMSLPYEEVRITSRDGLSLYGQYYEGKPGAPVQIMFHGYRSNAIRDFSGGMQLALKSGCSALLVDQRAHGKSEGRSISFGILERYDCLDWIGYVRERFGQECPIILTGLSMGAATVLMAAGMELPKNVVGVIADCGYSSPKEILLKVIGGLNYPTKLTYACVRLAGKLLGGFDIEETSAAEALGHAQVPVLFIHGEDDRFVPCEMSRKNYGACRSEKSLLTVPGAGHGISYLVDEKAYCEAVKAFYRKISIFR